MLDNLDKTNNYYQGLLNEDDNNHSSEALWNCTKIYGEQKVVKRKRIQISFMDKNHRIFQKL